MNSMSQIDAIRRRQARRRRGGGGGGPRRDARRAGHRLDRGVRDRRAGRRSPRPDDRRGRDVGAPSAALAQRGRDRVLDFADVARVDLTIDGADEIDDALAARSRARAARCCARRWWRRRATRMVVIADGSKRVDGDRRGDSCRSRCCRSRAPSCRDALGVRSGGARWNGARAIAPTTAIWSPTAASRRSDDRGRPGACGSTRSPGVVGHGLFLDEVDAAYIAIGRRRYATGTSAAVAARGDRRQPDRARGVRSATRARPFMSDTETAAATAAPTLHEDGSPERLDDRHDPHAVDGRGAEGELAAIPARRWRWRRSAIRCGRKFLRYDPAHARLAQPRPLRAVGRPRVDAALCAAPPRRESRRSTPTARRRARKRSASTTSSSSASCRRRRRAIPNIATPPGVETTTGPLGAGLRQFGRHGDRRALAGGALQQARLHAVRPRRLRRCAATAT